MKFDVTGYPNMRVPVERMLAGCAHSNVRADSTLADVPPSSHEGPPKWYQKPPVISNMIRKSMKEKAKHRTHGCLSMCLRSSNTGLGWPVALVPFPDKHI